MSREGLTNLDSVDISDIHPVLDQGITKLVKAIRGCGHTTFGSCQGGLDGDHHHHRFPWVTVSGLVFEDNPAYRDIGSKLDKFNKRDGVRWTISQGAIQPERPASNRQELEKLQASADELAKFLFYEFSP